MQKLIIRGGRPLNGTVCIHGAKNSILPVLAGCVLTPERCVITRCPRISDVAAAGKILTALGAGAEQTGESMVVESRTLRSAEVPPNLMGSMRASVLFLGALLARRGEAVISMPGGCSLGGRPIDYHVEALKKLGVTVEESAQRFRFTWRHRHGAEIVLPFPSVGATENLLLAATAVKGETVIRNAAREPEVEDLADFLSAMGAEIRGAGSDTIHICGGKDLHGVTFAVRPDRIETATYLAMAAACGGRVLLRHTDAVLLRPVMQVLEQAGCGFHTGNKEIEIIRHCSLQNGGYITTAAYPGFPTDAQAPLMAALLRGTGETRIEETVFPGRFFHVPELRKFGGDITVEGNTAVVRGVNNLHAARANATDLRGGAGVLIAALQADGESQIENAHYIARGYADLCMGLRQLGAQVREE